MRACERKAHRKGVKTHRRAHKVFPAAVSAEIHAGSVTLWMILKKGQADGPSGKQKFQVSAAVLPKFHQLDK
jgi:hypothetical protein